MKKVIAKSSKADYKSSTPVFAKKKEVKQVVVTKVAAKPQLVMNQITYPYGRFGLVNYTESATANHTDLDVLRFVNLPPSGLNLSKVVESQRTNMFAIYQSDWRLMYQKGDNHPGMVINTEISEFDYVRRNVEAIYLHDYLAGFREHENMWLKNYEKIFGQLTYEFSRAARNFRGCRSVIALSRTMKFKKEYVPLILSMWEHFEIPMKKNYNVNFRFYLFTSSVPGDKASEKLAFLNKLPDSFKRILCLIADDVNIPQLKVIIAQLKTARGTFVPTEVKTKEGKFIKGDYKPYLEMLKAYANPSASYNPPPFFIPEKQINDTLMKYYSRASNVVLF